RSGSREFHASSARRTFTIAASRSKGGTGGRAVLSEVIVRSFLPEGRYVATMDQEQIYAHHAPAYDALVSAEDCDHNLLPAIEAIARLAGASVIDVGAGTGRLTRLLATRAARLVGVDRSAAMLDVARAHLEAMKPPASWELHCADARALPVPS